MWRVKARPQRSSPTEKSWWTAEANSSMDAISSAELFDPSTGAWTLTGTMNVARSQHIATLLAANGLVLAAGGGDGYQFYSNTAELYNPPTGTWALTGS